MIKASSSTSVSSVVLSGDGFRHPAADVAAAGEKVQRHVCGSIEISQNGVSLQANHHLGWGGLCISICGFDVRDPKATLIRERLMLQPGERRVIAVPRCGSQTPVRFGIMRVGDGVQIVAGAAAL